MFQLFLRARAQNLKSYFGGGFKTRSSERDATTDRERIRSIMSAIENALTAADSEQAGLKRRLDDVLARAAVSVGNNSDEYLDREAHRAEALNFFDGEIARAESRLKELGTLIAHFKFMKTAMQARFPGLKALSGAQPARE
jgi:hypothetical protein